jgi:hypothetical protein
MRQNGLLTLESQRQDTGTDEGHQHQSADAPGERRQCELHVIGFENREGVDGDGIGKAGDTERPCQSEVAPLLGESDRLPFRPLHDVDVRASERPDDRTGLFRFLPDVEGEDASRGLAQTADEDDERDLSDLPDSEFERREENDFAGQGEEERDEERVDGDEYQTDPPRRMFDGVRQPTERPESDAVRDDIYERSEAIEHGCSSVIDRPKG